MPSNASKSRGTRWRRPRRSKVTVRPSPVAENENASYGYEFEATDDCEASCELPRLTLKLIGTLKELAPLIWSANYKALFDLERQALEENSGLMTAAMELKERAEKSTYRQRPCQQVKSAEEYEEEDPRRAMKMAAASLRQGNQLRHSFSTCARSLRALSKRMSKIEWKAQSMNRELTCRATALVFLKLVMAVRAANSNRDVRVLLVRT